MIINLYILFLQEEKNKQTKAAKKGDGIQLGFYNANVMEVQTLFL